MKKNIFFLIILMTIILLGGKVYAKEYTFYEAGYLDNIYMNKYEYSTNTIYYQKARMFKNTQTNQIAYCIEPLTFFKDGSVYEETTTPRNIMPKQLDKIQKIAYFGYQYPGHEDPSWYAAAQMMIWRESSSDIGDYYFTETLNGKRTNKYDYQMNEINHLIETYDSEIPIQNQTITMVEDKENTIKIGDALKYYETDNSNIILKDEHINIKGLKEGIYDISLYRNNPIIHNNPILIFQSINSQNMIYKGDLDKQKISFQIKVISTSINIKKLDKDTKNITPQGEAKLDGSVFEIYNEQNELVDTIEIINNEGSIKNIPFGKYTIKETIPGEGYELNEETYQCILSEENPNCYQEIFNKVTAKDIIIKKTFGEEQTPEENIAFEIKNNQEEIVNIITTNKQGTAEIILPYGTYTIKQLNTTEGYELVEPFQIIINNTSDEVIKLHDFKIPVPNTSRNKLSIIDYILYIIAMIVC